VLIGYIRVKTGDDAALRAQRQALQDVGCGRMVEDLTSGGRWDQPELHRMLDELRPGEVVVVAQLDGLGRSLPDVVRLVQRIGTAGAGLRSLAEAIDTTTPVGQAAAQLIGGLAAFGRNVARDRIGTGLAAARRGARGRAAPEADGGAAGDDRRRGSLGPALGRAHGAAAQGERGNGQPPAGSSPDRCCGAWNRRSGGWGRQ